MHALALGDEFWLTLALVGAGGIGIGVGLVVGAFAVRLLRHMASDDPPKK